MNPQQSIGKTSACDRVAVKSLSGGRAGSRSGPATGGLPSLFCLFLVFALAACTPTHTVRPLPDFIKAGVRPGDTVTVVTTDQRSIQGEVALVNEGALVMDSGDEIMFEDIRSIDRHSWKRPAYACGDGQPLGCSVPLLATAISDSLGKYKDTFHDACVEHDFCYRHGAKTYGHSRKLCDEQFLNHMKAECPRLGVFQIITSLVDTVSSRGNCLATADQMYLGVRKFGEKHYKDTESTYCEYEVAP